VEQLRENITLTIQGERHWLHQGKDRPQKNKNVQDAAYLLIELNHLKTTRMNVNNPTEYEHPALWGFAYTRCKDIFFSFNSLANSRSYEPFLSQTDRRFQSLFSAE